MEEWRLGIWDTKGELPPRGMAVRSAQAMLVGPDNTIYVTEGASPTQVDLFWPAAFASGELSPAIPGRAYSDRVRATGHPWPTFTLEAGSLPAGLTMHSDGTITGTPADDAATSTFTVKITNDLGVPVSKEVTLPVQ